MRVAFGAFVCASAIGCFVGDLLFFDFFGPLIVVPLSLDLDAVRGGLLDAVRDTLQPAQASVWLRKVAPL